MYRSRNPTSAVQAFRPRPERSRDFRDALGRFATGSPW